MAKKKYAKPVLTFEAMALSSDLSTNCHLEITFAEWVCPVLIPEWGETVYQQWNCDWSNDEGYVCYHVPTLSTNVFGS